MQGVGMLGSRGLCLGAFSLWACRFEEEFELVGQPEYALLLKWWRRIDADTAFGDARRVSPYAINRYNAPAVANSPLLLVTDYPAARLRSRVTMVQGQ